MALQWLHSTGARTIVPGLSPGPTTLAQAFCASASPSAEENPPILGSNLHLTGLTSISYLEEHSKHSIKHTVALIITIIIKHFREDEAKEAVGTAKRPGTMWHEQAGNEKAPQPACRRLCPNGGGHSPLWAWVQVCSPAEHTFPPPPAVVGSQRRCLSA